MTWMNNNSEEQRENDNIRMGEVVVARRGWAMVVYGHDVESDNERRSVDWFDWNGNERRYILYLNKG